MKKVPVFLILCAVCILPGRLPAQEDGGEGTPDSAANPFTDVFGSDFERLEAEEIQYSPAGEIRVKGRVELKTAQFEVKANAIDVDPEKNILVATGSPVIIRQGDIRAECKRFVHDIDKQISTLENNPVIYQQQKGGRTTKLSGDIITLFQDDNGDTGFNISMNKRNPNKLSEIVAIPSKEETAKAEGEKEPARKVDNESVDLIKLPATD